VKKGAFDIAAALLNAVPEDVMAERREKVAKTIDELTIWIPEPEAWTVVPDSEGAVAHLLTGNKVFGLALRINRESNAWTVEATSRSLDDRVASVAVKHGAPAKGRSSTEMARRSPPSVSARTTRLTVQRTSRARLPRGSGGRPKHRQQQQTRLRRQSCRAAVSSAPRSDWSRFLGLRGA
jgi:hypothetical protein